MSFEYRTALIIGGSSGVGRELALSLVAKGVKTIVAARNKNKLEHLKNENMSIETVDIDASLEDSADLLIYKYQPDLLMLVGGHQPKMAPVHHLDWQEFSQNWNIDTKIAFHFTKAALTLPMAAGGTIVSFSSGAALSGSALSGGYAGAKRMQHFLTNYGQREADRLGRNLTFLSVIPKQLMSDTDMGRYASAAYADSMGIDVKKFLSQWDIPLSAKVTSSHVIELLSDQERGEQRAFAITGGGIEAMG